jgi:3-deoxy-manno-octulosonate cytidylyltransferase (CMP-KDO synthetase)
MPNMDIVVNVQGDEPEVTGQAIDFAIRLLLECPEAAMSTIASPIRDCVTLNDPNCVKVVCDLFGYALYFSRSPIPFSTVADIHSRQCFWRHIGVYAYRREFLCGFREMSRSDLERFENLEQLRALSSGHRIKVGIVTDPQIGLDTQEDYEQFLRRHATSSRSAE